LRILGELINLIILPLAGLSLERDLRFILAVNHLAVRSLKIDADLELLRKKYSSYQFSFYIHTRTFYPDKIRIQDRAKSITSLHQVVARLVSIQHQTQGACRLQT
jgi:hypothetical protein